MSPVQCPGCGLITKDETGRKRCYALKKSTIDDELSQHWFCHYYLPIIVEDGQPLTPFQHFLIKQTEIDGKR